MWGSSAIGYATAGKVRRAGAEHALKVGSQTCFEASQSILLGLLPEPSLPLRRSCYVDTFSICRRRPTTCRLWGWHLHVPPPYGRTAGRNCFRSDLALAKAAEEEAVLWIPDLRRRISRSRRGAAPTYQPHNSPPGADCRKRRAGSRAETRPLRQAGKGV